MVRPLMRQTNESLQHFPRNARTEFEMPLIAMAQRGNIVYRLAFDAVSG
jgi:hypothetical protein